MNATCPAGIPKPQRVSDLGRLLNPEITAPLDSTAVDVVTSTSAWRLAICKAPSPRHVRGNSRSMDTRPPVCHPTSKKINFLKDVAFPKKRGVSLISLFEMTNFLTKTDDVHLASRSARRSRSFLRHPPASSPPCGSQRSIKYLIVYQTHVRDTRTTLPKMPGHAQKQVF